jgi:predicted dehydrogenase
MPDKREIRGPIRVGIVGLGNLAKYGHIPVLNLLPHYKLSTIYSQRRDAAESAVAEYGVTCVANTLDELVNHPEVDLVVILTTPLNTKRVFARRSPRASMYTASGR